MKVTLTQFRAIGVDANGQTIPVGKDKIASQMLSADGPFNAVDADATFVRICTDTAIHLNFAGGASTNQSELLPANSVEYLFVNGLEVFNVLTA